MVEEQCLTNTTQAAGADLVLEGFLDDEVDHAGGKFQLDALQFEDLGVLFQQRVLGLGEDIVQCLAVQGIKVGDHRQAANNFRDEAELFQVGGGDELQEVLLGHLAFVFALETHALVLDPSGDDLVDAIKCATADEEDI